MKKTPVPEFEKMARQLLGDAVTFASVTGINFFKDSFDKQGWTDGAFYPWPSRAGGNDGRAILVNTGDLRDSLRILEQTPLRIIYGTSSPKASIHNEGGTVSIRVTQRSRKFFWYMYKATGEGMWKAMALTKKDTLTVRMPQRKFIGHSETLMKIFDDWFKNHAQTVFKQYLNSI